MAFDQWDTVLVAFPFVEVPIVKFRPCVVISSRSFNERHGMVVMAMITTASRGRWPDDQAIVDFAVAGLHHESVVRWKVNTLPDTIPMRRIGALSPRDRDSLRKSAARVFW